MPLPQVQRLEAERGGDGIGERQHSPVLPAKIEPAADPLIRTIGSLKRTGSAGFFACGGFLERKRSQMMRDQADAQELGAYIGTLE